MKAGKLRHKIKIYKKTEVSDGSGGYTPTDELVYECRASIEPLRVKEQFEAMQIQNEVSHLIRMRYKEGLAPNMFVKYGTRTFLVEGIKNVFERNRELNLMVKEIYNADS